MRYCIPGVSCPPSRSAFSADQVISVIGCAAAAVPTVTASVLSIVTFKPDSISSAKTISLPVIFAHGR